MTCCLYKDDYNHDCTQSNTQESTVPTHTSPNC